jgi:hypothetical protein
VEANSQGKNQVTQKASDDAPSPHLPTIVRCTLRPEG